MVVLLPFMRLDNELEGIVGRFLMCADVERGKTPIVIADKVVLTGK